MPHHDIDREKFNSLPLVTQFDELMRAVEVLLDHTCESQFLQLALQFESCRQKWHNCEESCLDLQEKLTKLNAEKEALMVKLKLARQQIVVEMNARQKVEQERDDLEQQYAVIRELLENDLPTFNEEQQRKLEFLNSSKFRASRNNGRANHKLAPIDETGSFLSDYSDISFDETEDDLDSSHPKSRRWKRSHAAAQQRALIDAGISETKPKRMKSDEYETIHCEIKGSATLEVKKLEKSFDRPVPHQGRRRPSREHRRKSALNVTSASETESAFENDLPNFWPSAPMPNGFITKRKPAPKKHNMMVKQCVIVKETCKPCGKRIHFSKKAMKCSDCRLVAHPECESKLLKMPCEPKTPSTDSGPEKSTVEDFLVSRNSPQIPPIMYHTIQEIESRGMNEQGLYRVPGSLREVRELRAKFFDGTVPKLSEVADVHALCSLVKEFLRNSIKEPILTFSVRPKFIKASRNNDEGGILQAISELPTANRDTLVYLMLHLQRVVDSPGTQMSVEALSKAIGPSLAGYASSEPNLQDLQLAPKQQELVVTALLNLSSDYYNSIFKKSMQNERRVEEAQVMGTPEHQLFGPIISPKKTPSSSSLAGRAKRYIVTPFSKKQRKENLFQSPN